MKTTIFKLIVHLGTSVTSAAVKMLGVDQFRATVSLSLAPFGLDYGVEAAGASMCASESER
jgi:hypothetical protein